MRNQIRVVAITGATSGIGRATARRFAVERAHVALLARGSDGLSATAREVVALGGKALAISCDVADPEQVFAAVEQIERELGEIDLWINNAATTIYGRVDQVSPEELRRVTDVDYHGYVWGTQAALRVMRPRDRGTIVQVGSGLAYRSIPLYAAYCAAKHAMRAFTESLRSELRHDRSKVRLAMVQLPSVNTPAYRWCENKLGVEAQPISPIAQPELAAEAIHFAATRGRTEVWVGSSTIRAVLANKLVPGLVERYLARRVFDHQETAPPRSDRPSNLWSAVPGDHGAHGAFEFRARNHDPLARVGTWLGAFGVQTLAVVGAIAGIAATSLAVSAVARRLRG